MTIDQLMEKVRARMARDGKHSEADVIDATGWFIAVQEARSVFDSFSTKDLARTIQEGTALGGPYQTREDIKGWIEITEDGYDDQGDAWDWLDEALDRHFGIE